MPEIRDAAWWRAYRKTRTAEGRACVSGTTRHKPDLSTERNRRLRQRRKDAAAMAESPPAKTPQRAEARTVEKPAPSPVSLPPLTPQRAEARSELKPAPADLAKTPHRPERLDRQKSEPSLAQNVQTHQKREHATTTRREDPSPPGKWVFEDD